MKHRLTALGMSWLIVLAGCSKPEIEGRVELTPADALEWASSPLEVRVLSEEALAKAARPALEAFRAEAARFLESQTLLHLELGALDQARKALMAREKVLSSDTSLGRHKEAPRQKIAEQLRLVEEEMETLQERHPGGFPAPFERRLRAALDMAPSRTRPDGSFRLPPPEGPAWVAVWPEAVNEDDEHWWLLPAVPGEALKLDTENRGGKALSAWVKKRMPELLEPTPEPQVEISEAVARLAAGSAAAVDAEINRVRALANEERQKAEMAAKAAMEETQRQMAEERARLEAEALEKKLAEAMTSIEKPAKEILPGLKMLPVQAAEVALGSPESELGRSSNEKAVQARITRGFLLGRTEVTQAQWMLVMGDNPSQFRGASHPVEKVSWLEAMEFCEKLTAKARAENLLPEGWRFILPTEAQWELACRAGSTTALYNGKDLAVEKGADKTLGELAWYHANSDETTHAVAQKKANALGLHDMLGNVWEWCLDSYTETPGGGDDPAHLGDAKDRVVRGGSWLQLARACRAARRSWLAPDSRVEETGFRVACVFEPPEP